MKKSNLRKIIRESINQLMTEVSPPQPCPIYPQQNYGTQPPPFNKVGMETGQTLTCSNNPAYTPPNPLSSNPYPLAYCIDMPSTMHCTYKYNSGSGNWEHVGYNPPGPPNPSSCGPCNAANWPNYQNWITTWTSNNAFNLPIQGTLSNPNQPCTHICNKLDQWTTACQNAGPVQANQLACKIAEGQLQSSIHGCNC